MSSCDVLVIGGGPAGSAAARLLAAWGHDVVMATGRADSTPPLAESLPPSTRKLLRVLGLEREVEEAGFVATTGNTSWWGDATRALSFGDGRLGFQVRRGALDLLLREGARTAGARILDGATVVDVALASGDAPTRVRGRSRGGGSVEIAARRVLDCSGRAGVVARRGFRVPAEGLATVALAGVWAREGGWEMEEPSHTLVESYAEGWVWSVPISATERHVAAMVDPRATTLRRGGGLPALYRSELARTVHIRRLLKDARPVGSPWACGATPYGARRFGGDGFLLVGDAGSFLDPLSSYGVKKALASAWLAAVASHTALLRPTMAAPALELFEERERAAWQGYRALSARFHREAGRHHPGSFWSARAADVTAAASDDPSSDEVGMLQGDPHPTALEADPAVRAAFERLRDSPRVHLRPSSSTRWVRRPSVRGREVVLEERVTSPRLPGGLRSVRSIDVASVARLCAEHPSVPGLFEAYGCRHGPSFLPDFLGALAVLLATGVLENSAEAGPDGERRSPSPASRQGAPSS